MASNKGKIKPVLHSFTVLIGGEAHNVKAQALTGDALKRAEMEATTEAANAAKAETAVAGAKVNAEAAGWKTAATVAVVYASYRASGMDDGAAYAALSSRSKDEAKQGLLNRAGVSSSSAQRFAAAGRAIAAGVARKDGETLKAYASRVGGVSDTRASRKPNPLRQRSDAGEKALRLAGELRAALAALGDKRSLDLCDACTEAAMKAAKAASAEYAASKAAKGE